MTDNTSDYAGNYPGGIRITCILDEGAPTVGTSYDQMGQNQKTLTWAAELAEGDVVAISNDTACTFDACGGIPCVEKAVDGETLIIGQIVSTPRLLQFPAASADANDLSERLAGKYYRVAVVEVWAFNKIIEGTFMCDGTNAQVPGVATKLKFNITSGYTNHGLVFDGSGSGGVNAVPLHYIPAGTDGDLYTSLYGINGLMIAYTGA